MTPLNGYASYLEKREIVNNKIQSFKKYPLTSLLFEEGWKRI